MSNFEQFPQNVNNQEEEVDKDKVNPKKKSSWLKKTVMGVTGAVMMGSAVEGKELKNTAEEEFSKQGKDKTEQMVSEENTLEMQGQKAKIIKPFDVLSEADWKSVTDSSGYVSLYELAELIRRRVPGTYYIDKDAKNSYREILKIATQHRIVDDHQIFCIDSESNGPNGPDFGMISKNRDQFGKESTDIWSTAHMPDKLIYDWFEANKSTVEMVFATR